MVINFHKDFIKNSKKLSIKQKDKLTQILKIFGHDEFNPILNNHSLQGKYSGLRSINITGDLRAVYKKSGSGYIFITIGTHSKLYG